MKNNLYFDDTEEYEASKTKKDLYIISSKKTGKVVSMTTDIEIHKKVCEHFGIETEDEKIEKQLGGIV